MSKGDEILAQMLAAVPDSYQKTIGYPTYDWLAGAAIPTAQVSLDLEEAKRKLDPANLTGEELDRYLSWAMEAPGVGGVQVYPLDRGANTVGVVLIDQFGKPASRELVEQVQTYIDPGSRGLGEGAAPIGAYCTVSAAEAVAVDLSVTVTAAPDADREAVTQGVRDRVGAYLTEIALEAYRPVLAKDHAYEASFARIGAAILDVPGVEDYTGLTVNGGTVNVKAASKQAAVLGEVVVRYAP